MFEKTWKFEKTTKLKSCWQTEQHVILYQSCRVWDNGSDKTDWKKNFQKNEKSSWQNRVDKI